MKNALAMVKNLQVLSTAYQELAGRSHGVPGMGVLTGPTGAGKTTGIDWLVAQTNAVYVRAYRSWSMSSMLTSLMTECYAGRLSTNAAMVAYIAEHIANNRRPIFVDEGDHLFKNPDMLETLRDLHDLSKQPVIVVGMDGFERRLVHRAQFARRVLQWIRFKGLDLEDTRIYVDSVADVRLSDDLVAKLHKETSGSIGLMAVGVALIEAFAKGNGWADIDAKRWGNRQMVFTKAPGKAG